MNKYTVYVLEFWTRRVDIEAESEDEAREQAINFVSPCVRCKSRRHVYPPQVGFYQTPASEAVANVWDEKEHGKWRGKR